MPTVSCIMPTFNRRDFVTNAIDYFRRQIVRDTELIIVDDGTEPVHDLVPDDKRIRYVRLSERRPIGAKRNLACDLALGELIAHWDDDDWYSDDRLHRQAAVLGNSSAQMCGLDNILFYDLRSREAWRFDYPPSQRPWLAGNSLMYRRSFWMRHRFPEIDIGEDSRFVWSAHPQELVALGFPSIHVGVIHDNNISLKQTGGPWWHPHSVQALRELLGTDSARYGISDAGSELPHRGTAITPEIEPAALHNVYACLVHEQVECVIDLVRNLRYLDPNSTVLLYDGGNPPCLSKTFPADQFGAICHPEPQPQVWGKLHGFAIDCMRYALANLSWDTMTIVDSDQLALRPGFSRQLARHLAGRRNVGMLGRDPMPQPFNTQIPPAATAMREVELWRPFLRRFPDGESKFVHWTFWPGTVFTAAAARDLVHLFDGDEQLHDILSRSSIWATEEVLLPTLVALLGYDIAPVPTNYDYVAYRTPYSAREVNVALTRSDVYWAHPVPRRYQDPFRDLVRTRCDQYQTGDAPAGLPRDTACPDQLHLVIPILDRMRHIAGWLEDDEADLLIAATHQAIALHPEAEAIVEVGSYLGRATVVLASVVQACRSDLRVHAVDPHVGHVGALDTGLVRAPSSVELLRANLDKAGVGPFVETHRARAAELVWNKRIALLLVDGLHDYASIALDFFAFERWLPAQAYVAFHDYAHYFPAVVGFVNDLLAGGEWQQVSLVRSLIVLKRIARPTPLANELA